MTSSGNRVPSVLLPKTFVYGTSSDIFCGSSVVLVANINLMIYACSDGNDVTLLSALPGDFDIDGDVDGFDFLKWQLGGSPSPLSASDLADWEANYGMVAPLSAVSAAVPEPATWIVVLAGMVAILFRRDVVVMSWP